MSGKLMPSLGVREEGEDLALGVFTQDLAQDLPQDMRAVDVVTSAVRLHDPTLSDERARSVLGALGLTGEKSLRLVGHLSGGEKARVALARFVLIPHNLLLLDEPSNHLDHQTLTTLTTALRGFEGATLVISHDREFLEKLVPTHVLTVRGGRASLEERGLRESDFDDPLDSRVESKFAPVPQGGGSSKPTASSATATATATAASAAKAPAAKAAPLSDEERKKRLNAPRRIAKIEALLEKNDKDSAALDADMITHGRDSAKLKELQKQKDELQKKSDKLVAEMEDLMQYV